MKILQGRQFKPGAIVGKGMRKGKSTTCPFYSQTQQFWDPLSFASLIASETKQSSSKIQANAFDLIRYRWRNQDITNTGQRQGG